jgi:hypothetical protein
MFSQRQPPDSRCASRDADTRQLQPERVTVVQNGAEVQTFRDQKDTVMGIFMDTPKSSESTISLLKPVI